jgi:hypothetical protein
MNIFKAIIAQFELNCGKMKSNEAAKNVLECAHVFVVAVVFDGSNAVRGERFANAMEVRSLQFLFAELETDEMLCGIFRFVRRTFWQVFSR